MPDLPSSGSDTVEPLAQAVSRLLEAGSRGSATLHEETWQPRKVRGGHKIVFQDRGLGWLVGELTFRWTAPDTDTPNLIGERQAIVTETGELLAIHRDRGRWVQEMATPAEGALEAAIAVLAQLPVEDGTSTG